MRSFNGITGKIMIINTSEVKNDAENDETSNRDDFYRPVPVVTWISTKGQENWRTQIRIRLRRMPLHLIQHRAQKARCKILLACSKHIDNNDDYHTNSDPDSWTNFVVPKPNEDRRSAEFGGKDNSPVIPAQQVEGKGTEGITKIPPVIPTHSKREGRVNKALGHLNMTSRYWKIGNHFAQ